jgi:hypothetical protein
MMRPMNGRDVVIGMIVVLLLGASSIARAQPAAPESKFSAEVGIGWDNSISGNINSSAIGRLDNVATVITKNTYDDVYNQGLHLRFGGGYMLKEDVEARATFTFQSSDADLARMGDYGASPLYGQFSDYQSFALDVGLRKYHRLTPALQLYGEGTIGLGFVDKVDVTLVAPAVNLFRDANDFYDQTAAFAWAINGGVLFQGPGRVGVFAQLGVRKVSGMSEVDDLVGTGLEEINDNSGRWTIPFLVGARVRF